MKDMKESFEHFKKNAVKVLAVASRHRIILMILVVGIAVSFALVKTRSFIDIPRNETKYNEEKQKIHYDSIDQQTLKDFQTEQQDQNIQVSPRFEPNRNDPFSE